MKKIWEKLSLLSRYYIISMSAFVIIWPLLAALKVEFLNILFFSVAYIWHFSLTAPGLREKVLLKKQRFSFLSVVVRVNYYLQLFISSKKIPFKSQVIRALSPLIFILFLIVLSGNGNIFYALLGSFCFEIIFYFFEKKNKTISMQPGDQEIPPAIPSEENFHE